MEWHLNDLSVTEIATSTDLFKEKLDELMSLRAKRRDIAGALYCSRSLLEAKVAGHLTFRKAVEATGDKTFIYRAKLWFANSGPFWEENRQENADDLFYFRGREVQETALGEAARRRLAGTDARAFSFVSPGSAFDVPVIELVHGLLEAKEGQVVLPNARSLDDLRALPTPSVKNWNEVLDLLRTTNPHLVFADHVSEGLKTRPFNANVVERLIELLAILDSLSAATNDDGTLSEQAGEIFDKYFKGHNAAFSSEEPKKRNTFEFHDLDRASFIYCPWHGKINIGDPFRFHYQWPRPKGQKQIKVLYMGQKLTKS